MLQANCNIYIYIYIYIWKSIIENNLTVWRKIEKNIIQSEELIGKESGRYNVSVLINHNQDFRKACQPI